MYIQIKLETVDISVIENNEYKLDYGWNRYTTNKDIKVHLIPFTHFR